MLLVGCVLFGLRVLEILFGIVSIPYACACHVAICFNLWQRDFS